MASHPSLGTTEIALEYSEQRESSSIRTIYNIKERQLGPAPINPARGDKRRPQLVSARHAGLLATSARLRTAQ